MGAQARGRCSAGSRVWLGRGAVEDWGLDQNREPLTPSRCPPPEQRTSLAESSPSSASADPVACPGPRARDQAATGWAAGLQSSGPPHSSDAGLGELEEGGSQPFSGLTGQEEVLGAAPRGDHAQAWPRPQEPAGLRRCLPRGTGSQEPGEGSSLAPPAHL